jgi:hypothetical protein
VQGSPVCQYPNSLPDSQFTLTVRDPCEEGTIISSNWEKPLVARQLETDATDLTIAIPAFGGVWPWYSEVAFDLDKPGVCGPIGYSVTYENGDSQDLVRLTEDATTLVFEP